MTTCKISEISIEYNDVECQQPPWENDPQGLCLLHSRREDKDRDGAFTEAVRKKLAQNDFYFMGVYFPGDISFSEFDFTDYTNFSHATFSGNADFSGATFSENVYFSIATFSGTANFSEILFEKNVYFFCSKFLGEAWFFHSHFDEEAVFSGSIFHEKSTFSKVNFSKKVIFSVIQIKNDFDLVSINLTDNSKLRGIFQGELSSIEFFDEGRARFKDVSFYSVALAQTDLLRCEFIDVDWHKFCGRNAVYDEILLHQRRWAHIAYVLNYGCLWCKRIPYEKEEDRTEKPTYSEFAQVERLYRQLKINYEDMRDFKRVGDFHYGEMEMHRRGSPWRQWVPFSWHNIYRMLSGYGERPLLAFIWLLLLIPAWAGLVWWLGIDLAGAQTPVNYWQTLLFIFEKATLQRPPWADIAGINGVGKFLASLSVLLIPGQAALFILALRNRLGRRR